MGVVPVDACACLVTRHDRICSRLWVVSPARWWPQVPRGPPGLVASLVIRGTPAGTNSQAVDRIVKLVVAGLPGREDSAGLHRGDVVDGKPTPFAGSACLIMRVGQA
jgi:hypothetical protein